jgi:drug/metabolite transporter (DMT)-like permease
VKVVAVILIVAGLYLLLDHSPPFPLNHEDIGLGKTHLAHSVFGVVALIAAVVVWRRA